MKTLNLIPKGLSKPLGMALIAGTILSISPMMLPYGYAQEAQAPVSAGSETLQGQFTVDIRDGNRVVEQVNLNYTVRQQARTEIRVENGRFRQVESGTPEIRATIAQSAAICSGNCAPREYVIDPANLNNIEAFLRQQVEQDVAAQYKARLEEEREIAKRRGNLEERKRRAERCEIKIEDENDASKDIRLSRRENLSDRLSCKMDRFEARIDDGDFDSDIEEYRAFKREFGSDLESLVFSNDEDASEILNELADRVGSQQLGNYVNRLGQIHGDYQGVLERAQQLSDPNISTVEQMQLRQELLQAQNYYSQPMGRAGGDLQAIVDYRSDMLNRIQQAFSSPSSLLGMDNSTGGSILTTGGRLQRQQIGTQIPTVNTQANMNTNNRILNRTIPGTQFQQQVQQPGFPQQGFGAPRVGVPQLGQQQVPLQTGIPRRF